VFRQAESNLRENLQRLVDVCRGAHVPVVLSTVASNIRDQSPMRAVWPASVSEERRSEWEELVGKAEHLLEGAEPELAIEKLVSAEAICSDHARLQFRKGQCLEKLNRLEEARKSYVLARDLDYCRFRAPSSFAKVIRDVATAAPREVVAGAQAEGARPGVVFLDIDSALDKVASGAGPGFDLYLEHVHYNAEGHRQLGRLFARCIQEHIRGARWEEFRVPSDQELATILGATPEDELAAYSFSMQVFQTAPLRGSLDHARQERFTGGEISRLYGSLPTDRRDAFAEVPMNVMSQDLVLALAELHQMRKNPRLASEFASLAVLRRPWSPEAQLVFARACDRRGEVESAKKAVKTALELRPDWPAAAAFQAVLPDQ
jgi:tetratricopeptide (TPR) repeat protein